MKLLHNSVTRVKFMIVWREKDYGTYYERQDDKFFVTLDFSMRTVASSTKIHSYINCDNKRYSEDVYTVQYLQIQCTYMCARATTVHTNRCTDVHMIQDIGTPYLRIKLLFTVISLIKIGQLNTIMYHLPTLPIPRPLVSHAYTSSYQVFILSSDDKGMNMVQIQYFITMRIVRL